jgi:hypothetical protein
LASQTPEFLEKTFSGETLHDTVYVTSNPQLLRFIHEVDEPIFHSVVSVMDLWDPETHTVHPDEMSQAVKDTQQNYPNKKIIAHFLQPHTPFIGQKSKEIREQTGRIIEGGYNIGEFVAEFHDKAELSDLFSSSEYSPISYQELLDTTQYCREDIVSSYRETLDITLREVSNLIESLDGKSILTADHGECFGERLYPLGPRLWGHPGKTRTEELCKVPWVEFPTDSRREVTADVPQNNEFDQVKVEEKLKMLGYQT